MKSSVTKEFRRRLDALPIEIQEQASQTYSVWRKNPFHPGIRYKKVSPNQPIFSVRIGLGYRALGLKEGEHMYWFWIGTHAEYDELLKHL